MIDREALKTASACRHYSMCKIDYLGTGLCPAVESNFYASYYPVGRMDLYRALAEGTIPVTEGLADIADSCTLCGICDKQCYFVTELRPLTVMRALKDAVEDHRRNNGEIVKVQPDELLTSLRSIVGEPFATNDPAHLAAYAGDPCPIAAPAMPRYIVLPRTRDEIVEIVRLSKAHDLPYTVRGNGANTMGFTDGAGAHHRYEPDARARDRPRPLVRRRRARRVGLRPPARRREAGLSGQRRRAGRHGLRQPDVLRHLLAPGRDATAPAPATA